MGKAAGRKMSFSPYNENIILISTQNYLFISPATLSTSLLTRNDVPITEVAHPGEAGLKSFCQRNSASSRAFFLLFIFIYLFFLKDSHLQECSVTAHLETKYSSSVVFIFFLCGRLLLTRRFVSRLVVFFFSCFLRESLTAGLAYCKTRLVTCFFISFINFSICAFSSRVNLKLFFETISLEDKTAWHIHSLLQCGWTRLFKFEFIISLHAAGVYQS